MPKIKVDRIVSFSTEDPVHEARNVLSKDPSKKWKCQKEGEKSASIVLQLDQASIISSIDIGNEHSAYIEVLVSRSSSADDYKVFLVMSSFMSPLEARQSTNVNKVRMFSYNELQSPERDQKWDRVKIVCTQPFNRHVQYGLSFITLNSPEGKENINVNTPAKIGKFLIRPESPDNLTTGSLFARRKELADDTPRTAAAAIREASSSASSNSTSPKCKPRLKEATIVPSKKDISIDNNKTSRNRNELLYSKDDENINEKIDKLIEEKNKETKEKKAKEEEAKKKEKEKKQKQTDKKHTTDINKQNITKLDTTDNSSQSSSKNFKNTSKRKTNDDTPSTSKKMKTDKQTKPFNRLLEGVTIVISGIQNPERADIRSNALELGAKYKADWDNTCTHLICAFTNTPKYNQVKSKGKIVNRMWVQDCYSKRKRLPWRRYALDRKELAGTISEDEIWEEKPKKSPELEILFVRKNGNNEDDTDTELEDSATEMLEKATDKLHDSVFSNDTEEESIKPYKIGTLPELPNFLEQKIVYIDSAISEKNRLLLSRYIIAFNGTLVDDPSEIVDFVVAYTDNSLMLKDACPNAYVVKPEWVLECHNERQFVQPDDYQL